MKELPHDVWQKMSVEEKDEILFRSMCGYVIHNMEQNKRTIIMGSERVNHYAEYVDKMIEKYGSDELD